MSLSTGCFFFFKQKTAYEMRISDWSSDVCSSDLLAQREEAAEHIGADIEGGRQPVGGARHQLFDREADRQQRAAGEREDQLGIGAEKIGMGVIVAIARSEEHTSELQSLMRISYAVFCLKKTTKTRRTATEQ